MSIKPFHISIPEDRFSRLKQKLFLSDFPTELLEAEPWSRGTPLSDIKKLSEYWANGFNWRDAETKLNSFPQYMATVTVQAFGSYDVHFIHQPSSNTKAIPLLFLHGWPGSFIEVTKILPQLVQGGETFPAFHVVAPSLIGFGFSSASKVYATPKDQSVADLNRLDSMLIITLKHITTSCNLWATLNMVSGS